MSNNRGKNWFRFGWHPAEEDMLLCLDGEASERQADKVRVHLEGCWACRNRRDKLDRAIAAFMDYCEADATDAAALPPRARVEFAERLRVAASAKPKPSLIPRWANALRWQFAQRRLAAGALACLVIAASLTLILLRSSRTVSAQELLTRTSQAEALSLSRVGEPVVYRKLQVKRVGTGEPVVWESWNDAHRNQFRQRVADKQGPRFLRANEKTTPTVIAELEQIFRANQFDSQRPLSAAAFAEWRKSIKTKSETVAASSADWKLTTIVEQPYAVNAITEASLIVRKRDWHAIALHLQVQGEREIREYELSETAYEVLPWQALAVLADFAPTPSLTPSLTPSPRPTASPSPSPAAMPTALPSLKPLPSEADLKEAEVAALYALHQAQADLGEQIEVVRDPNGLGGQVEVRGLVETSARKRHLAAALSHLSLVTVRLQSVEEVARQTAQPATRATEIVPASEPATQATLGTIAFEKKLAQYFAGRGESQKTMGIKIAELSDAVIVEASAARSEAWALRRLAERFAAEKQRELAPEAQARLDEMARHHRARLRATSDSLRARLEPILTALGGTQGEATPPRTEATWQARAQAVFNAAQQVNQLAGRLFAEFAADAATPEQAARQMLAALARLDHALRSFEQ